MSSKAKPRAPASLGDASSRAGEGWDSAAIGPRSLLCCLRMSSLSLGTYVFSTGVVSLSLTCGMSVALLFLGALPLGGGDFQDASYLSLSFVLTFFPLALPLSPLPGFWGGD